MIFEVLSWGEFEVGEVIILYQFTEVLRRASTPKHYGLRNDRLSLAADTIFSPFVTCATRKTKTQVKDDVSRDSSHHNCILNTESF